MKIVEQTPNQLTLRYYPYHIWLQSIGCAILAVLTPALDEPFWYKVILSLSLLIASAAMTVLKGDVVTCSFNKQTNTCTIQQEGCQGTRLFRCSLRDISSILVEETYANRKRRILVYRVYLQFFSTRRVALLKTVFYNKQRAQQVAWQLCDFLKLRPYAFAEAKPRSWFSWI